jgi:ATP-dependent DNA helicase RecQ
MSGSDYDSSDESSSEESGGEEVGELYVEERLFGPKPWNDPPLTAARLAKVVSEWVDKDWKLRPGQFEVVKALRPSGRVFCGFPTAAGKTLIACANALLDFVAGVAGVHVICQPLQALVAQTAAKLGALYFSRTRVKMIIWDEQRTGGVVDIDFMDCVVVILSSPEALDDVFSVCRQNQARVRALMIDEAHLREEWPFRNYLATDRFTSTYPLAMVGIFSATMETSTIEAMTKSMGLHDYTVFDRDNVPTLRDLERQRLRQLVIRCCLPNELDVHIDAAAEQLEPQDSIVLFAANYDVFCSSDGRVFSENPKLAALEPMAYSARYDAAVRASVIEKFSSGACRFVIATCAFGTGVDFPNIRYVFLDRSPRSWASFMQHAGRAGRGDFKKEVFVTMACSPVDLKFAERRVQIMAFYCPSTKSVSKAKKIKCPDCQEERPRPPIKNEEFSGRCFDFSGVACDTTRQACMRTIAGFFQGLYVAADLVDRKLDCKKCSACSRTDPGKVVFLMGNKARIRHDHVKHAGFCGIVANVSAARISVRNAVGIQHTLAPASLVLESEAVFAVPTEAVKNKLSKEQQIVFGNLIRGELLRRDLAKGGLFCASGASDAAIKEAAKLLSHTILPGEVFAQLLTKAKKSQSDDGRFDHAAGFKSFLSKHEPCIEAAGLVVAKKAQNAIKRRKK